MVSFLITHVARALFTRLGGTIDDAPGEAFDKIGAKLCWPCPNQAGPAVVESGAARGCQRFAFPRPCWIARAAVYLFLA
ncbi:MAG: hypothetical protein U5N55_06840 [Cypionkella sp.]|nr:hypothetical protein [Cypionkella sp.]